MRLPAPPACSARRPVKKVWSTAALPVNRGLEPDAQAKLELWLHPVPNYACVDAIEVVDKSTQGDSGSQCDGVFERKPSQIRNRWSGLPRISRRSEAEAQSEFHGARVSRAGDLPKRGTRIRT
jgi:hypothetical protein